MIGNDDSRNEELANLRTFQKLNEMNRLFQTAVARAQAESRLMEVPNVYFLNGELYYELPDGQLTTKTPEIYQVPALQTNR